LFLFLAEDLLLPYSVSRTARSTRWSLPPTAVVWSAHDRSVRLAFLAN
jgi:hypothetical protein